MALEHLTKYIPPLSRLIGPLGYQDAICPNCGKADVYVVDPPLNRCRFFLVCGSCGAQSRTAPSMREVALLWEPREE